MTSIPSWQTMLQGMMEQAVVQPDRIPQLADIGWISVKPSLPPRRLIDDGETTALGSANQTRAIRLRPNKRGGN